MFWKSKFGMTSHMSWRLLPAGNGTLHDGLCMKVTEHVRTVDVWQYCPWDWFNDEHKQKWLMNSATSVLMPGAAVLGCELGLTEVPSSFQAGFPTVGVMGCVDVVGWVLRCQLWSADGKHHDYIDYIDYIAQYSSVNFPLDFFFSFNTIFPVQQKNKWSAQESRGVVGHFPDISQQLDSSWWTQESVAKPNSLGWEEV